MNYSRVLPRDLFNEAKLLKCLGFICLKVHDCEILGLNINHENEEEGFIVHQNINTGDLYVSNLHFFDDNGTPVYFYSKYNAKDDPYPFFMEYKNSEYIIFNDNGELLISKKLFKGE